VRPRCQGPQRVYKITGLMEAPVEIRYAGVVIGRAQDAPTADGDSSFFLAVREPMPVGSVLHLRSGDRETPARVVRTVESADPAACGMRVRLIGEAEEVATEWIPPPAPATEKGPPAEAQPKTAMRVIEVQAGFALADADGGSHAAPVETKLAPAQTELRFEPEAQTETAAAAAAPEGGAAASTVEEENPAPAPAPAGKPAPVEAVPQEIAPAARTSTAAYGTLREPGGAPDDAESSASTVPEETPAAGGEEQSSTENLPPARPIAGPSGRRKTKRRR
jgi:hypothetical protein